ncbi:MAG: serine hydrolase [Minwuiales bacterium]|nr:serine hydrolase [Minwuiales bacterium]
MPNTAYVPPPGDAWQRIDAADAGFDAGRLAEAVRFAEASEIGWSRDLNEVLAAGEFEPPPWNELLGPVEPRGPTNGLLLRHGRIVAEWGETTRADMTFSVAKSYLAILAGIAVGDGLIRDVADAAGGYALDDGFESPQNRAITWEHLLHQTSEWEGELWSKPDLIDRNRQLGPDADNSRKGTHRDLAKPGDYWEYNDVRVNRLSLSLMQVFRRALPDVLAERVMRPVGASDDWAWHGYRNSTIEIDGREMTSVPGGSHWGGGLCISARDQARLGLMVLRGGAWDEQRILPQGWTERMLAPCPINPQYGYLWWLNTDRQHYPSAPASSAAAVGAGGNIIWIDPEHDIVLVARWLDNAKTDAAIGVFLNALL